MHYSGQIWSPRIFKLPVAVSFKSQLVISVSVSVSVSSDMDMVIIRSRLLPLSSTLRSPLTPSSSAGIISLQPPPLVEKARWRCVSEEGSVAAGELPGRERRRMRQQRREANTEDPLVSNWREQVEDRLLLDNYHKKKKQHFTINSLSDLGPQWWALQVSRNRAPEIAAALTQTLSAAFTDLQFKLYNPSIRERSIMKDGFIRVKHRPLVPGTIYLHCILNRHVHHLVEACQGVVGFSGSQVVARYVLIYLIYFNLIHNISNWTSRLNKSLFFSIYACRDEQFFTKPRPVSADDIEAILLQEKQEQESADKAFEEKHLATKRPPRSKKLNHAYLLPGVSVRVISGPFADYTGCLKQLNLKKKKVYFYSHSTLHLIFTRQLNFFHGKDQFSLFNILVSWIAMVLTVDKQ